MENPDDLTPENIDAFMKKAAEDAEKDAMTETWQQFKGIHEAMIYGGFSEAQANTLLVELMWKFMKEASE
ncbi:MAG: hypothetical protein ABR585_13965 [Gemmatimonadaceae bacterium]|nr:hypothetical protein [Actinomycetota bacterium]